MALVGTYRWPFAGVALGVLLALAPLATSRPGAQVLFLKGQNVQPAFEGWMKNPDGSFDMVFGYLNRNYEETPHIPIGANNVFQPEPADRGQPTFFYPRKQSFVFKVTVPPDWGDKRLVWTLTCNGRTSTAVGKLTPVWELDAGTWKANRGTGINGNEGRAETNLEQFPSVAVEGPDVVAGGLQEAVTLRVTASDDGRPGPHKVVKRANAPSDAAEGTFLFGSPGLPTRTPRDGPTDEDMVDARAAWNTGLAVSWILYRGPGTATFDPRVTAIAPKDGKLTGTATTKVRFSEPGSYIVRAVADDSELTTGANITVTVRDNRGSGK